MFRILYAELAAAILLAAGLAIITWGYFAGAVSPGLLGLTVVLIGLNVAHVATKQRLFWRHFDAELRRIKGGEWR